MTATSTAWANLTVAGAFVLGAVLSALGTIRIVRAVSRDVRDERRRDR